MILKFTTKIVQKEWRKLLLPFFSVLLTATIVTISFLLIDSAKSFVNSKNLEILGGDIVLESSKKFEPTDILKRDNIKQISSQISFSGLLENTNANFKFVDNNFPLYGKLVLQEGEYLYPETNQVYIDESLSESLAKGVGQEIVFNNASFTIKGIVKEDPENLVPSFTFSGKIYFPKEAIDYANVDLSFFRKEFSEKITLREKLSPTAIQSVRDSARPMSVRVRADSGGQSGFMFGLEVVEKFLVVTILVISILSLVNIYASVNYLSTRLRRSFAILISLGMNLNNIYKILFFVNILIIFFGSAFGMIGGYLLAKQISIFVGQNYSVDLQMLLNPLELFFIFGTILITSIFATFPVLNRLRNISPKELLTHGEKSEGKRTIKSILFDVCIGVLPITFLAMYFLESIVYGGLAILAIIVVYGGLMFFYHYFISFVYKRREIFNFPLKMITTQKKFDGFFGLVTFASLFVALASVYNLSIVRTSVSDYLRQDLSRTLPSTYVLDVQNSQEQKLKDDFPELTLFPNIRARIISIDNLDIVKTLEDRSSNLDRELGREFNLTYRNNLLPSEKISEIKNNRNFENISIGEVSVEKDFAKKANIKMGSQIEFLIQGIKVKAEVTSIREVDSRSGFPFFYFIFSPEQLQDFPKTMFGYANYSKTEQVKLKTYLSKEFPNVTVIDTGSITEIAENLIEVLLLIILIITFPPLLLSAMLIVTILASVAKERKRDGARLMALGKTNAFIRGYYILESVSTTILASIFAYGFALFVSNYVIMKYLKIDMFIIFDNISFYIFIVILLGILLVSVFLWNSGNKSLKEYLNYEENN